MANSPLARASTAYTSHPSAGIIVIGLLLDLIEGSSEHSGVRPTATPALDCGSSFKFRAGVGLGLPTRSMLLRAPLIGIRTL